MINKYLGWNKLWLIVLFGLISTHLIAQGGLPEDFDDWIENSRKEWKIPGMAVGIVKDGKVVYAKGFGEKRLGENDRVDAHTVFSIASVSKNITAAALAILVDEGKIDWDDKIIDHIPWFRLKDAWVTEELSIRDVLTHRSGLGRILGNRLQFQTQSTRDEVLYQMRYMELEKPFRSDFVYNNVMYSLAGQIIEYVDGRTWDQFLQERLFQPLNMQRTTTNLSALEKQDNIAYPHQEIDGKLVSIPRRNWDNAGPAGGVNASIADLNQWMLMQLGVSGVYEGETLVSAKQMTEIHRPQMVRPSSNALASQGTYGFGWNILDYKGKRVWTHGGATDGFNTAMFLMPELELGIVVVGNTFNNLGNAVAYQVMDAYLGESERDWNSHYLTSYKKQYQAAVKAREAIHNARIKKSSPSLKTEEYVGTYISEGYGKVEIEKQGKDLIIRFWEDENLEAVLEHWHFDTYRALWKNPALREEFMQFHLGKDGKIEALDFEFVLRPMLLQVGAYPSNYLHIERFVKQK